MEFEYKGRHYVIFELCTPNTKGSWDLLAIFEQIDDEENPWSNLVFVDYFYGVESDEGLIHSAKFYIDHKNEMEKEN